MNSGSVAAIRSLNRITPSDAQAGNALLQLLGGVGTAALCEFGAAPDDWFVCGTQTAFAVSGDGMTAIAADVDLACDALDAAEPLLQQIEALLGLELDPHDLRPKRDIMQDFSAALVARICGTNVTLWIALPPDARDAALWQAKAEQLRANLITAPVRITVLLNAARLTIEQAAGMAVGDLLLLPHQIPAMILAASDFQPDRIDGRFDGHRGSFDASTIFDDGNADMPDDDPEQSGAAAAAFAVPVTLQLPGQFVDAATLTALAPGYVLPLSPLVQGLQVNLLVGGQRIARGEIVELGDSFAVHIDERVKPRAVGKEPDPAQEDGG